MTKYVVFCYYMRFVLMAVISWMTLIYYSCPVWGATVVDRVFLDTCL